MTTFVGIDPGLDGAIAAIYPDGNIAFYDTPTLQVGKKRQYDLPMMVRILRNHVGEGVQVAIEQQQAMPARIHGQKTCALCKQPLAREGGVANFRNGLGFGIWLGILGALQLPYTIVHPVRWKRVMLDGMPREKDASRQRAMQLFPQSSPGLQRKKDHNRADALLLASYLRR